MKDKDIYDKIQEVADKIAMQFEPQRIILFGSYAWGEPTEDSDVDLFIVKETDNTREEARRISRSIFPRPFPMDIIVYRPLQAERRIEEGDFFLNDILLKGNLLYAKT